ncbi:aromatic ring-hydroxylating dioxygenase subunit alpha [Pendulispora rubella]|uniref:Aromatic ring-hydroxylating dioxygenase subunit alpha n=1 Tax=Pendulispora rubella TaxID=2741070 RepID=A0ABZ2KYR5_9BACT
MDFNNLHIPKSNWFIAARSDQLGAGTTLKRRILGESYVFSRDARGRVLGREEDGAHSNLRVVEQDDWIWVHLTLASDSTEGPPSYPRDPKFDWFELHNVMNVPLDLIVDNGVDCGHTGFVHPGLFRSKPQQFVRATLTNTGHGVRIDTSDEQAKSGTKDFRSFFTRNQKVTHYDEFIIPHTVYVEYATSDGFGAITILICTPEDEQTTRVYTRMGVKYGRFFFFPATWFVKRLVEKIVAQDKVVLEGQADNIRRFGNRRFRTVTADLPTNWIQRTLRRETEGKPQATGEVREISYKL